MWHIKLGDITDVDKVEGSALGQPVEFDQRAQQRLHLLQRHNTARNEPHSEDPMNRELKVDIFPHIFPKAFFERMKHILVLPGHSGRRGRPRPAAAFEVVRSTYTASLM